jgi:hypothetical protein
VNHFTGTLLFHREVARGGLRRPRFASLFADDYYAKGAGLHFTAALTGSWSIEVGGRKKDVVSFQVEGHGASATLGGDILDDSVFVGGVFVNDGEIAIAAGREDVAGGWIEAGGVWTIADLWRRDDSAGVRVHDCHDFFIADGEEAAILEIHGETRRRLARCERPAMSFRDFLGVELH